MTKKKASAKTTAKTKTPARSGRAAQNKRKPSNGSASAGTRVKVRMYRQGLGDCFLITIPRSNGAPFYMLIDCGVILGTANPKALMTKVVQDIIDTTDGHLDVLAGTHEHWDHVSGFIQAQDLFQKKISVDEVWLGWTEDPHDALAKSLQSANASMRLALASSAERLRIAGDDVTAGEVNGMLEFFGAAGATSTRDAMKILKGLSKKVRYCRPTDAPIALDGTEASIYVLGPPHDEKMIKKINPSTKNPETYGMTEQALLPLGQLAGPDSDLEAPFETRRRIPMSDGKQIPFFERNYWGEAIDSDEKDQAWRRIDGDWLQSSSELALALDSATNNTSLVLALQLADQTVLLFAADAQVGNWLSWQDLQWKAGANTVTGPELLDRTILYKVGHHGSHNATLRQLGLEEMSNLQIALLPVDHQMALKKRWGQMPFEALLTRLDALTKGFTLRIDQPVPPAFAKRVTSTDLYYEVAL